MADKPPAVLHRLILAMHDEKPSDDDWPIGLIDSGAVAEHVVKLHNEWLEEHGEDG